MGQYQQWLHYQEIDRRLRATVETLEIEMARLESQLDSVFLEQLIQQGDSLAANPIISTLIAQKFASTNGHNPAHNELLSFSETIEEESAASPETFSPELPHREGLPDFGPEQIEQSDYFPEFPPFSSATHPEIELLPEDMFAFMDEHGRTDPQVELPWWLRKITITSGDAESGRPIDQESMRTNRLVQRLVERWGRQPSPESTTDGESEDTPDAP